jgi:hypothetical protein
MSKHIVDFASNAQTVLSSLAPALVFPAAGFKSCACLDLTLKTAPHAHADSKEAGG